VCPFDHLPVDILKLNCRRAFGFDVLTHESAPGETVDDPNNEKPSLDETERRQKSLEEDSPLDWREGTTSLVASRHGELPELQDREGNPIGS
jgi:hypothetical protein